MNRKLALAAAGLCLAAAAVAIAAAMGLSGRGKRPDENGMYTAQGHWVQALDAPDVRRYRKATAKLPMWTARCALVKSLKR